MSMPFSSPATRLACVVGLGATLLAMPGVASAQSPAQTPETRQEILLQERQAKAQNLAPEDLSTWEARLLRLQKGHFPQSLFAPSNGVFPVIGGLPPGSGFVLGAGMVQGATSERLRFSLAGRVSTTAYKSLDAQAVFPTAASRLPFRVEVDVGYRDLRSVSFFGLGNDSSPDNRTSYGFESRRASLALALDPHPMLEFGVRGAFLNGNLGPGARSPSFGERFIAAEVPGSIEQPEFVIYGGHLGLKLRDRALRSAGVTLLLDGERYDGRDHGGFDFTRVAGEVQAHVPLGHRNRMLAFRFRTSHAVADSGSEVPVYLMETIGGANTIRGLPEYRYRDSRNVVMNLEYRWEVWNYMDFVLFGDAGKVFAEARQFDLADLQASYGFGIRTFFPGGGVLRFDLARSHEGIKLHIGGGPSF